MADYNLNPTGNLNLSASGNIVIGATGTVAINEPSITVSSATPTVDLRDDRLRLSASGDLTKKARILVSPGQTTGTTRDITLPSTSTTLVGVDIGQALSGGKTYEGLTITATSGGVLTIDNNKTFRTNNTLTLAGTDGSTLNVGTGGTLGTAAFKATGTSGNTVPLLDGTNTWSGVNTFSLNAAALPAALSGTVATFAQANGTQTRVTIDAFGAPANFTGRRANTSAAAPSALNSNDTITAITAFGYGATGYGSSRVAISLNAAENWSDTAQGTRLLLSLTALGAAAQAEVLRVGPAGGLMVIGQGGSGQDIGAGLIYSNAASFMIGSKTTYNNGAGAGAGTIANAPAAGNPTKWIPVDDAGTTRYIPAW